MAAGKNILISGRQVTRTYSTRERKVTVLSQADFEFADGSCTALVGRSGAGKTTLLNLIGGLDRPDSGQVLFGGTNLAALTEGELASFRNRKVGFIFQSFFLRENRSALSNVMVPLLLGEHKISECRARAREALEEVALGPMANEPVRNLSGGQRQRVAIARAISNHPRLILADEPTGSLDADTGREILDLLFHYNREKGATVVIVTHDPLVERYGVPIMTVRNGKIEPAQVREHMGAAEAEPVGEKI